MKNEDQVQRAHDMLAGVVVSDLPKLLHPEDEKMLIAALDALCWVLDHAHNSNFADNLRKLEAELVRHGYECIELPGPPANRIIQ